jgi:hypothetical protein
MKNQIQLDLFDRPAAEIVALFDYPTEIPAEELLVDLDVSICQHEHHKEYGQVITCSKCGSSLTCGPFEHACPVCEPFLFERCEICRVQRVFCTC